MKELIEREIEKIIKIFEERAQAGEFALFAHFFII